MNYFLLSRLVPCRGIKEANCFFKNNWLKIHLPNDTFLHELKHFKFIPSIYFSLENTRKKCWDLFVLLLRCIIRCELYSHLISLDPIWLKVFVVKHMTWYFFCQIIHKKIILIKHDNGMFYWNSLFVFTAVRFLVKDYFKESLRKFLKTQHKLNFYCFGFKTTGSSYLETQYLKFKVTVNIC